MNFRAPYLFLVVLIVGTIVSCDSQYDYPTQEECYAQMSCNSPIASLYDLLNEGKTRVDNELVLVGRVTAKDMGGNFYRKIVVEDCTAAVEVNMGFWNLDALYPVGMEVVVAARGMGLRLLDGVAQLGLRVDSWNSYRTEPLGSRVVADRFVVRNAPKESVRPTEVSATEFFPSLCGRLVRIDGTHFVGTQPSWGEDDYLSVAERLFEADGVTFAVATSRFADFATCRIPTKSLALTGILYCGAAFDSS